MTDIYSKMRFPLFVHGYQKFNGTTKTFLYDDEEIVSVKNQNELDAHEQSIRDEHETTNIFLLYGEREVCIR